MSEENYRIPDLAPGQWHRAEETIRGSRFIVTMAHTDSIESAKAFIEAVRAEFSDATHNCWAYQASKPETTARIGASDDGEPKGTAGRPMLTVLLHCGVGEVSAVVTRYFGGTLLGTGGLVRAYQGLVKLGLETLPTTIKVPSAIIHISIEHRFFNHVESIIEKRGAKILEKNFASNVELKVRVPLEIKEGLVNQISQACAGRVGITEEAN